MIWDNFAYLVIKVYVVGVHQNHLAKVFMNMNNIGFYEEPQTYLSIIANYHQALALFGILITVMPSITNSIIMVMKQFCHGLEL